MMEIGTPHFFHLVIWERRRLNSIGLLRPDGAMASNPQEVCDLAVPYFAQLFSATLYIIHEDFFE